MNPNLATDAGASCADAPLPLPIDVVALSAGLPDGTYYAGKKLTPWMSFEDRLKLRWLDPHEARRDASARLLWERRAAESIVVRWAIEGGLSGVPTVLRCTREEMGRSIVKAYIWGHEPGDKGHVDVFDLTNFLMRDCTKECGEDDMRTDRCFEELNVFIGAFGDEWLLSRAGVRKLMLAERVRKTRALYEHAVNAAKAEGVDVDAIGEPKSRRKRA
jgi:hypothetical protein